MNQLLGNPKILCKYSGVGCIYRAYNIFQVTKWIDQSSELHLKMNFVNNY